MAPTWAVPGVFQDKVDAGKQTLGVSRPSQYSHEG